MKNSTKLSILAIILFLLSGLVLYSNSLDVPFYLDDAIRIQHNPKIQMNTLSLAAITDVVLKSRSSRPVGLITFALNYYFHQLDPKGYHIINILIHILTATILFFFLKFTLILYAKTSLGHKSVEKTDDRFPRDLSSTQVTLIALFTVLLWIVHPLHTNSVTYIGQRLNSLAAMFYLLSFVFYIKARLLQTEKTVLPADTDGNREDTTSKATYKRYVLFAGSVFSWVMALGSKQTAATLPFFIFLYEWYFFQDLDPRWFKRHIKYIIGIIVLFGLIALVYLGSDPLTKLSSIADFANREFTISQRFLTQFRVVLYYVSLFFFPHPSRLNLDHDFSISHSLFNPITTVLSLAAILGLIGLAIYLAKKERLLSFCILWYFGNLIIESSVIPLAIIFEHRTYMPTMMLSLAVIVLLYRYIKLKWAAVSIVCVMAVIFAVWTYQRNEVWKDKVIFWNDCVEKSPNKARPHYNLGMALAEQEHMSEAIDHFATALKLKPNFFKVHNSLGSVLMNLGKTDEAIHHFSEALKLEPQNSLAYYNLGVAFSIKGNVSEAVNAYTSAIRIDPEYTDALMNLGNIRAEQGSLDEAIGYYNTALEIQPANESIHYNLGILLMNNGNIDESIQHFQRALQLRPDFSEAQKYMDQALNIQSAISDSIPEMLDALKDDPQNPKLYFQLGNLYVTAGKLDQAITQYQKALQFMPTFSQALHRLAIIYAKKDQYDKSARMFEKLATLHPDNSGTYYNIACMYAKQNKIEKSIVWLKKAINKGYDKWDLIKTDTDLENIRGSSQYYELIKNH